MHARTRDGDDGKDNPGQSAGDRHCPLTSWLVEKRRVEKEVNLELFPKLEVERTVSESYFLPRAGGGRERRGNSH